jgi:ABC-2 type transport system ATP-binding protein
VLTTHDLADIERLCRRLVVIDHGSVVHDGTIEELHARYGSRRRLVVDLDAPLPPGFALPGTTLTGTEADGHRVTFALDSIAAGAAVASLVNAAAVRDLSVVEPDIEDVVAKLYTATR